MSDIWSAGTFLARARELGRRLECWHFEDPFSPGHTATEEEARRWVRLTFREITRDNPGHRPKSIQIYHHEDGQRDEHGCVGVVYNNPERPEDHSLTQWLIGDFRAHLDAASPPSPALDYLKETFADVLDLPAWTVRGPETKAEESMLQKRSRQYMVVGRQVPAAYLDALTDAAEKLLTATSSNGTASVTGPGRQDSFGASTMQYPPVDLAAIFEESVARKKQLEEVDKLRAEREAEESVVLRAVWEAEKALAEAIKEFDGPSGQGTILAAWIVELCQRLKVDAKFHHSDRYETNIKTWKRTLFPENVQKVADRIFLIAWEGNTDDLAKILEQAKQAPLWPELKDYLLRGYQQKILDQSGYREFGPAPDESGAMVWEETRYYDLVRNPGTGFLERKLVQRVILDQLGNTRKDVRYHNGEIISDCAYDQYGNPAGEATSSEESDSTEAELTRAEEAEPSLQKGLMTPRERTVDEIIDEMSQDLVLTVKQIAKKLGIPDDEQKVRNVLRKLPSDARISLPSGPKWSPQYSYRIDYIVPRLRKLIKALIIKGKISPVCNEIQDTRQKGKSTGHLKQDQELS
jgi:hypothetical protein